MPQIVWLPEALDDLDRLIQFLRRENPPAAADAARCILAAADQLRAHADIGRRMPDDNPRQLPRREWFAPFGASAYVLRYRRVGDTVTIIRVWHGRETR